MNVLTLKNHNNDVFPKWASFQTWTIFSCFIICCRLTSVMKRNCKCVYSQPTVEAPEFNKRDQYHGSVLSRRLERCEACTTVDHNIKYLLKTWAFFFLCKHSSVRLLQRCFLCWCMFVWKLSLFSFASLALTSFSLHLVCFSLRFFVLHLL